jgi:hypothetical protein
MDKFEIIHEIIRIAQATTLGNGIIQLVLTDGNIYADIDPNTGHDRWETEDYTNKVVIDVVSMDGTDEDTIRYSNDVVDFARAYGVLDYVAIQPSSETTGFDTIEEYLDEYHRSGICLQWINGNIVTKTWSANGPL